MNSPTIVMERDKALEKLEAYEEAAKNNPRAVQDVDKGLMEGYRLLAKGRRLIDVNDALKAGGLNLAGIPKLAISRAHVRQTTWQPGAAIDRHYTGHSWSVSGSSTQANAKTGRGVFAYGTISGWGNYRIGDDRALWSVPAATFDGERLQGGRAFRAMTPLIPLPHRPRHKLENYFLLWEASWTPAPPVDPYLLRPVTGSLMEIVAEWDLSPLEVAAVRIASGQ